MQTVIVLLIVAAAAFFMVRRFYRSIKKGAPSTCGCGCSGCSSPADACPSGEIHPQPAESQENRRLQ